MGMVVSLVTFFAAEKKVTAAPHRGSANRPTRKQDFTKEDRTAAAHQGFGTPSSTSKATGITPSASRKNSRSPSALGAFGLNQSNNARECSASGSTIEVSPQRSASTSGNSGSEPNNGAASRVAITMANALP